MKLTWHCLATGHGDTCPETGDTQRGAEKHAEQTGHCTSTLRRWWAVRSGNRMNRAEIVANYAAWASYLRKNADAADMYEAMPTSFNTKPRHFCECGTPTINDRCRWCRRGRQP